MELCDWYGGGGARLRTSERGGIIERHSEVVFCVLCFGCSFLFLLNFCLGFQIIGSIFLIEISFVLSRVLGCFRIDWPGLCLFVLLFSCVYTV